MPWPVACLIFVQGVLLAAFCFYAFFNYLYGFASLRKPTIPRVAHSGRRVAVVIVSYNEKHVLESTVSACDVLTYDNRLIVLADDSDDPACIEQARALACARGCRRRAHHGFVESVWDDQRRSREAPIELWEGPGFTLFHRPANTGFKGGSLARVAQYLTGEGIELIYLLDADWHPQPDALERTLEVLEADHRTAFVQTKRVAFPDGMNLFQKYVALHEEGCYYVDFQGRQAMQHPILFSGCCTLMRLDAIAEVGGFVPGHLTEDLDLTNRLWINGWKGMYLDDVVNHGEVPFAYEDFRRQQERWSAGSARALREYFFAILGSKQLGWLEKASAIRQNAYFTSTVFTAFAIALGVSVLTWLATDADSFATEYYLLFMSEWRTPFLVLVYACIASNFVEPLIAVTIKRRCWSDLLHMPMSVWYAWSTLHTYFLGNLRGLFGVQLNWFRTPKFRRDAVGPLSRSPWTIRMANCVTMSSLLWFYYYEGATFGWIDVFALLWLPAFLIGTIR